MKLRPRLWRRRFCCCFKMFPRSIRTFVSSSILTFFIVATFLMVGQVADVGSKPQDTTKERYGLLAKMKNSVTNPPKPPPSPSDGPDSDLESKSDSQSKKATTTVNLRNMVPVFQDMKKPGVSGAHLTVEQYLKRLGKDDLKAVPVSSDVNNDTVVLDTGSKAKVPNVVHYINFKAPDFVFGFARYVAFLSVYKYIKPGLIIVWGDDLPDKATNEWWARTLKEFPNIYYVFKKPVETIADLKVDFVQHKSDWLRIRILQEYGGIYMDHDVFALRSFADLLKYPLTMGRETPDSVSPGIILSAPDQDFLRRWQNLYKQYKPKIYSLNSNLVLSSLAKSWPLEIHIVKGNFTDPYPNHSLKGYALFCGNYDLTYNYAVHIYRAVDFAFAIPASEAELAGYNCTLGNAMRTVLYDDPSVRSKQLADGCVTKY